LSTLSQFQILSIKQDLTSQTSPSIIVFSLQTPYHLKMMIYAQSKKVPVNNAMLKTKPTGGPSPRKRIARSYAGSKGDRDLRHRQRRARNQVAESKIELSDPLCPFALGEIVSPVLPKIDIRPPAPTDAIERFGWGDFPLLQRHLVNV
jgi:hypothetical protein